MTAPAVQVRPSTSGRGPGEGPDGRRAATHRRRRLAWVAMAVVLVSALAFAFTDGGDDRTPEERARDLASSVMCPTCAGQSAADSDAQAAVGVRDFIADRIAEGASDDEIRDELAARYSDEILLTPGRSGVAALVWALPVAALVAALGGVALAFRRWRGWGTLRASAADRAVVERAAAAARAGASAPAREPTGGDPQAGTGPAGAHAWGEGAGAGARAQHPGEPAPPREEDEGA